MPDGTPKSFVPDAQAGTPKSFVPDSTTPSTTSSAAAPSALGRGIGAGVESFAHSWGVDPAKVAAQPGLWGKAKEAGKEALSSASGAIKSEWDQPTVGGFGGKSTPLPPSQSTSARMLFPLHLAARGIEGIAGGLESATSDISKGTPEGIGSGIGQIFGLKSQVAAPEHVTKALKTVATLIERQPTVEQGKIGYVNQARQSAQLLDHAVRETGVGARAQSVIAADKLDLQRTQSPGKVNTADAVLAAQAVADKTKLGGVAGGYPAQMPLDSAKALITQLGREASRLERTGKAPEAASVWAEYDALRKATQDRANELGGDHGRNWADYIKEHKSYMQLQNGLLGHITEGEHASALNKIIEHAGQLPELQKWFDKYRVDMSAIRDAAVQGKKLQELTAQSSNAVMGKIKLLSRHWALGLPALAGAHAGASAMGLGGGIGGFILPLIIAGKVGGLLDTMQVKELLYDLKKRIPPEQMQVAPSPVGPLEQLHTAASAGTDTRPMAQGGAPAEPVVRGPERRGTGVDTGEQAERRSQTTPDRRAGYEDKLEAARRGAPGVNPAEKSLARQVEKARKDRSVFKGRRGGTK